MNSYVKSTSIYRCRSSVRSLITGHTLYTCILFVEYTRNRFSNSPVVLRDIDSSNESEKGWTRINTLKHYKVSCLFVC